MSIVVAAAILGVGCGNDSTSETETTPVTTQQPDVVANDDHEGHDHSDHAGHDHHDHQHDVVPGEKVFKHEVLKPETVDVYVKEIQTKLSGVQRIEVDVTGLALDAGGPNIWKRLDVYKLDGKIVQIEVVPVLGELTETFFYKDWQLVHAYIDMNGLNNSVLDESETALRYYFNQQESIIPSVGDMGIPTDEQIRQKGNTVLNVAINSKK